MACSSRLPTRATWHAPHQPWPAAQACLHVLNLAKCRPMGAYPVTEPQFSHMSLMALLLFQQRWHGVCRAAARSLQHDVSVGACERRRRWSATGQPTKCMPLLSPTAAASWCVLYVHLDLRTCGYNVKQCQACASKCSSRHCHDRASCTQICICMYMLAAGLPAALPPDVCLQTVHLLPLARVWETWASTALAFP